MRRIIFLMGLPGSGKSTLIRRRFLEEGEAGERLVWIDSDEFKLQHPRRAEVGSDELHRWSVQRSLEAFWASIKQPGDLTVVVDGTGAAKEFTARIREAKGAGFRVELFVVDTPLETCRARMRGRARGASDDLLLEKLRGIAGNYAAAVDLSDCLTVIDGETGLIIAASRAA